ncbi:MAG: putative membrane protein YedE/YeeE [Bacteroidia bacterium]|jgi:uncharacterized membrane protein YedE/YeeE
MKFIKFLFVGIFFGIVLSKSEIISWYRIQEMFRFQSFHMYGVIGSAIVVGAVSIQIIKKLKLKNQDGDVLKFPPKEGRYHKYLYGGIIFGFGWALTGCCPGPMYILFGYGYHQIIIVIAAALLGTIFYGLVKHKLPH